MEDNNQYEIADLLWKAIIEDFIIEVIDYFYIKIGKNRDENKPIEFLDKFLQTLHPEAVEGNRRADLLVKVPLKNGTEKWILFHIEVQGYQDKTLPRRMFTYYYRSLDKYGVPVEALVIYTDNNKQYRPNAYVYEGHSTSCRYEFNTFKLADYKMSDFDDLDSPIGIIFQTALVGMKRNLKDEQLLELKKTLHRNLLGKGYSKKRIRIIGSFIRDLIRFKKIEFNRIFVEEANKLEQKNQTMGVLETVKRIHIKEGEAIGKEIGKEIGLEIASILFKLKGILNLLTKFRNRNLSNEDLSDITGTSIAFVKNFKEVFTEEKNKKLMKVIKESEKLEDIITVKIHLIKKMSLFGFSTIVLAEYFQNKEQEIQKIINDKNLQ